MAYAIASYGAAAALFASARPSARIAGGVLACGWLLIVSFHLLAAFSAFSRGPAAGVALALAALGTAVAKRCGGGDVLRRDLTAFNQLWRAVRSPGTILLLALTGLAVGPRIARSLVAPPLAWDALTYHLLKAGRWVQAGTWTFESAPDAWSYYEFFPAAGDALWAWAILPTGSDALLGPAGLLVWLAVMVAAYAAARAIGAARRPSLMTALAVTTLPCVLGLLTSAYVSTTLVLFLLLACCFLIRVLRCPRTIDAVAVTAALALAAAVQHAALPLAALSLVVVSLALGRRADRSQVLSALVALSLVAALPAVPSYLRASQRAGSLLYPLRVEIAGRVLSAGNAELADVLSGATLGRGLEALQWGSLVFALFGFRSAVPGGEQLNFGPGALALLALGFVGIARLLRSPSGLGVGLFLLAMAAVNVLVVADPGVRAQLTYWSGSLGRFLAPGAAALILGGALARGAMASGMRFGAILLALVITRPRGFSPEDLTAMRELAAELAPWIAALVVLVLVWRSRVLSGKAAAALGVVISVVAAAIEVPPVRREHRYQIYAAAADHRAFDMHPGPPLAMDAWPVWRRLDREGQWVVAFAAGWDGVGHNWARYPLLGSRLQNEVVYIPITRDGAIVDYRELERLKAEADACAWLSRLVSGRVDVLALGAPHAFELAWVRQHQELFSPLARGPRGFAIAYAVEREAIAAALPALCEEGRGVNQTQETR